VKPGDRWVWGASGKHPSVKDYISLGEETPVLSALSRWVEQGFPSIGHTPSGRSWRFFTRGLKPGELACGLLKDSSDGAGRAFPLLMVGYGRLEGWEKRWDRLAYAFDNAWERMEFFCVKRLFDLDELKGDISRLPQPCLDASGQTAGSVESAWTPPVGCDDMITLSLTDGPNLRDEAFRLLEGMKQRGFPIPASVFIGGPRDRILLIVFMRSLKNADFETLWTI
jgi:hypothetical protein